MLILQIVRTPILTETFSLLLSLEPFKTTFSQNTFQWMLLSIFLKSCTNADISKIKTFYLYLPWSTSIVFFRFTWKGKKRFVLPLVFFKSPLSEMKSENDVTPQLFAIYKLEYRHSEKLRFKNLGKIVEKYHFNKVFSCRPATKMGLLHW